MACRRQSVGNAGVSGEDQSAGRAGIHHGLLSLNQRLKLVIFLAPWGQQVPAQAVVKRQIGPYPPTVLGIKSGVFVAQVKAPGVALRVTAGDTEQKVREIRARLRSLEQERAVVHRIRIDVDLVQVNCRAEFEHVLSHNPGEIVGPLIDVVGLCHAGDVHTNGEVVERDVFNPFQLRSQRYDARFPRAVHESLGSQGWTHAAHRPPHVVGRPHVPEAQFVDRRGTKRAGQADAGKLRASQRNRVEAGNIGAALSCRIRVIQPVIVGKIVCRKRAPPRVGIDPQ